MEKMESVLRRFHLIKEPRESEARQQLKRELFAFNKVRACACSSSARLNDQFLPVIK